jgi:hypothetical protein
MQIVLPVSQFSCVWKASFSLRDAGKIHDSKAWKNANWRREWKKRLGCASRLA